MSAEWRRRSSVRPAWRVETQSGFVLGAPSGAGRPCIRPRSPSRPTWDLVHVGLQAHNAMDGGALQATSLDHALWFHREAVCEGWMLYVQRCPVAAHGRGLAHGAIFTRDGRLVASAAQEFLARRPRGREGPS